MLHGVARIWPTTFLKMLDLVSERQNYADKHLRRTRSLTTVSRKSEVSQRKYPLYQRVATGAGDLISFPGNKITYIEL